MAASPTVRRTPTRPTVTARMLSVLAAFDEAHPRLTLTDVAARAGLPLSTAHRLLAELESWRAVDRDDEGRYAVGQLIWQLGTLAPIQRELREAALPPMQDLYEATQENVHLAVLAGATAMYVERIYGQASVPLVSRPGRRLPLHVTGVGKVLLAHADPPLVERVLRRLAPVTPYTITESGRMARELAAVRSRGYAQTAEEMTLGTCSVAVPVAGADGRVVAALGLVTRTVRRDLVRYVPAMHVAAAAITRGLGAPGFRSTE